MVKNEFGQSGLLTLKLTVFQERTDETGFLHAGTISHKLNGDWKFWGWACSKMGVASLVMGL